MKTYAPELIAAFPPQTKLILHTTNGVGSTLYDIHTFLSKYQPIAAKRLNYYRKDRGEDWSYLGA